MKRITKFLISGGLAAAIEYASFLLLHTLFDNQWLIVTQSVSFLLGFVVSFSLNRTWVFVAGGSMKSQLVKYSVLAAINLVLTNILLWLLVERFSIVYWLSKIIIMAMVATWNYVLFSRLIFHSRDRTIRIV